MANKKFSEFTSQTDSANVQFVVGYNGSDNVRISPSNLLGAYLPLVGGTMTGNIIFNDNVSALFGTSSDMTIKHDGSHSKIENNTGHLYITNESDDKDIIFTTDNGSGGTIEYFRVDGGAERNIFSKSLRLLDDVQLDIGSSDDFRIKHTSANNNTYVQNFTGHLYITNESDDKSIYLQTDDGSGGSTTYLKVDGLSNYTEFPVAARFMDSVQLQFGSSADGHIVHDGTDMTIQNSFDDGDLKFKSDDGSGGVADYFWLDGGIVKTRFAKEATFGDDVKLTFGNVVTPDLEIYHDGSNSYIKETGTGNLFIQSAANVQIESSTSGENMAVFNENGAVELYYDNSKKIETTSSGIDVTGTTDTDNLTISGAQGSDGQVLTSTGSGVAWEAASGGATSLNGLTDVLIDGTSSYLVNIPASLSGNPADNTVFGNGAGNALTSGSSNTFIGHDAGAGVSGDEDNVAIGEGAFSASNVFKGVAVGYHAGKNNNGNYNVFIGENAGYNTSSSNNTSVGNNAGRSVTANDHTSIGYQAGYSNTSGSENTNVGHASGYSNTTSSHRTSIGYYANQYITGNQNTAVGSYALRGVSGSSTGQYNTAVGYTAGEDMTTGTTNTLVGWGAGKDITTGSNNSCIGNGSAPSANDATNEITLGNSSITAIRCQVQTISALSDERDKTNIKDSAYGLDFVNSLKPVTFDWNMRDGAKVGQKDLGFIAQDLQELDDENLQLVYSNNPEKLEASYGRLIPVLVKAIQDLSAKVTALENA